MLKPTPLSPQAPATEPLDGQALEPNTPEERGRSWGPWPAASPSPAPPRSTCSSSGGGGRADADVQKLAHNWDWDDLLGHMGGAQLNEDPQVSPKAGCIPVVTILGRLTSSCCLT